MQKIIAFVLCFFAITSAKIDPPGPVWANQWQADFHEEINDGIFGKGNTTGTLYYDWTNNLSRVDRDNGIKDHYCGSIKRLRNTACSHIVVDDIRYIYYPQLNYCCACCTKEQGCGLLKPTWIKNSTYVGQVTLDRTVVDEWIIENIPIFYYETPVTRIPVEIAIDTVDKFDFNPSTYKSYIEDPNIFKLPSICRADQKCPALSGCNNPKLQSRANRVKRLFGF